MQSLVCHYQPSSAATGTSISDLGYILKLSAGKTLGHGKPDGQEYEKIEYQERYSELNRHSDTETQLACLLTLLAKHNSIIITIVPLLMIYIGDGRC